jgi:hypothetical protein
MKSSKPHTEVVTATALAAHLFCSREAIARLEKQHVLQRLPDGGYDLDDCRRRVLEHLRERRPAVSTARQEFEKARAEREKMRAAQMAGTLCRVSDFHEAHDALLLYMVAGLTAIPARCSRDLAMRKTIQAELNAWRGAVADEFKRRAEELGRGAAA